MSEAKPCPFCGFVPVVPEPRIIAFLGEPRVIISCPSPHHTAQADAPTREEALALWNRRVAP